MTMYRDEEGLIELIIFGQIEAVKDLIENKSNVNVENEFGQSAALMAAKQNNLEILQMLADTGADFSASDFMEQTPLYWAQHHKNKEMINLINTCLNMQKSN